MVEPGEAESETVLSVQDVATVIVVVAGLVTAIGVFAGPYVAEKLRGGRVARRDHFMKIKVHVLTPMQDSIHRLLVGYFRPSESFYVGFYFTDTDRTKEPPKEELTLLPGPVPVALQNAGLAMGVTQVRIEYYDELLFDDLGNHFPSLKSELDRVEKKVLKIDGAKFTTTRWELAKRMWFDLLPKVEQKKHNPSDVVKAGLLVASNTPKGYWPNLYAGLPEDGTLNAINDFLKTPEAAALAKDFVKCDNNIGFKLYTLF